MLLLILFAIAALAVRQFVFFLEDHIAEDVFQVAAVTVGSLTLGFMLIAGAFGLWAIRFAAEAESRRRIGRLVDAMHYISDGILAVDRRGRVSGSNPAIRLVAAADQSPTADLPNLFPCLSHEDCRLLLDSQLPLEIERQAVTPSGPRFLRFRSQPAEGLILILVSDVTAMTSERERRKQSARLQLIGELARGVACDIDNLFCAISGHTSLIERLAPPSQDSARSLGAIQTATRRGAALSNRLLALSRFSSAPCVTDAVEEHVRAAAVNLRQTLPERQCVEVDIAGDLCPAGLSGMQVAQLVVNLGIAVSEETQEAGTVVVRARPQATASDRNSRAARGTELTVFFRPSASSGQIPAEFGPGIPADDIGILGSVIRGIVEGCGGHMTCRRLPGQGSIYTVCLPAADISEDVVPLVPDEIRAYIADWRVLCAGTRRGSNALDSRLRELVAATDRVDDVSAILPYLERHPLTDALVLHERALGHDPDSMLRALIKLHPAGAVVVLTDTPGDDHGALNSEAVFLPARAASQVVTLAMVDARGMAARRSNRPMPAGDTTAKARG